MDRKLIFHRHLHKGWLSFLNLVNNFPKGRGSFDSLNPAKCRMNTGEDARTSRLANLAGINILTNPPILSDEQTSMYPKKK